MAEIIKLKDFLKPSYEAIEKEKKATKAEKACALFKLLESDGADVAKSLIEFLASAFVDLSDGATCLEWTKQTENMEIYLTIKRKGQNEQ